MVIEAPGWLGTSLVGCGLLSLRRLFHLPESFEGKFQKGPSINQLATRLVWEFSIQYTLAWDKARIPYNVWMNVGRQDDSSVLMWGMRNWSYHPSWALLHSALTRIAPFQSCPIWRFPKSWGYPQLSSFVVGIFQYTHSKSYWTCPFIVELPIKKMWFSIVLCMFTRG